MSFITKRERVFNEYNLFDLPARNEGKLKAYSSCTDARAWSHFISDKTEHLVDIIKRNNEKCRPKYIPTEVIVNTLMVAKNTEIARLKRKLEEFEQLLAAYDVLQLTVEQKSEIANAHASIRAANKELDDLYLDLDLSGYTEGIDSEAFETGKSRGDEGSRSITETAKSTKSEVSKRGGDEWSFSSEPMKTEIKSIHDYQPVANDAETCCCDPRIEEMQKMIIRKDAKLNAMQNTIAVLENDVCEPYCIYAQIYTALEKIFGILCQNTKYKQYLELLTVGQDTRHIHIKGKILYKIKVLEKFSLALISPCNQDSKDAPRECSCYHTEIVAQVETTFALTSQEHNQTMLDNKRAQLVADIIDIDEMRNISSNESIRLSENESNNEYLDVNYKIDKENLQRLTNLQSSYNDLVICYEKLENEKNNLYIRCQNLSKLENDCKCMQNKLNEYNQLWSEKEYFRKRSDDLDKLKESYYVLTEETSNLELKLKAETEINKSKTSIINDLQKENILLEKKLNETSMLFEKERNAIMCKLKECECSLMCKEQQIKSLNCQIEKLIDHNENISSHEYISQTAELLNEIAELKDQINKLTDEYLYSEEEKLCYQKELEQKLNVINELKFDVESCKGKYEEVIKANDFLNTQIKLLLDENQSLSQNLENNSNAIDNLHDIIKNKSQEIKNLIDELEYNKNKNEQLLIEIQKMRKDVNGSLKLLENEIQIKVNNFIEDSKEQNIDGENDNSQNIFMNELNDENESLNNANKSHECVINKIKLLREESLATITKVKRIQDQYNNSVELKRKESGDLQKELEHLKELKLCYEELKEAYKKLIQEKDNLEAVNRGLCSRADELNALVNQYKKTQIENDNEIKMLKDMLNKSNQREIDEKDKLQLERTSFINKSENLYQNLQALQIKYDTLIEEKNALEEEFVSRKNDLHSKITENNDLLAKIESLKHAEKISEDYISLLKNENLSTRANVDTLSKEMMDASNKLQYYKNIENECQELKSNNDKFKMENEILQHDLNLQKESLKKLEQENENMKSINQNILIEKDTLEKKLEDTNKECISTHDSNHSFYTSIKDEISNLKNEKKINDEKMFTVMNKLDYSEKLIVNLYDDISTRDNTISELQNHINELQSEIKLLHKNLDIAIESGEGISKQSSENIDRSIQNIKAHYSKATHNMKAELVKLQDDQLTKTKHISLELDMKTNKLISQLKHLQNEREKIVLGLKQLEENVVGYSSLFQDCTLENILTAMDHISKCYEEKNSSLKDTLIEVKNSYQVLKNKAEEAKNIAENEIQKNIVEKENLQTRIKSQEIKYEKMLEDLEAEMLNQKLVFKQILESKEIHIGNLKKELQFLKEICEKSKIDNETLQKKLNNSTYESNKQNDILEQLRKEFNEQTSEIQNLQNIIDDLNDKTANDHMLQTESVIIKNDCGVQTNDDCVTDFPENTDLKQNELNETISMNHRLNKAQENDFSDSELSKSGIVPLANEVQILTAKIEPTFDFVRNVYQNYKIKRLQTKSLEQFSFTSIIENIDSNDKLNNIARSNLSGPLAEDLQLLGIQSIKEQEYLNLSEPQKFTTSLNSDYKDHVEKLPSFDRIRFPNEDPINNIKSSYSDKNIIVDDVVDVARPADDRLKSDNTNFTVQNNYNNNNNNTLKTELIPLKNNKLNILRQLNDNLRTMDKNNNNKYINDENIISKPKLIVSLPRVQSFTATPEDNQQSAYSLNFNESPKYSNIDLSDSSKNDNSILMLKTSSIETKENKSSNDNSYQQLETGSNIKNNNYKIENDKSNLKSIKKFIDSESSNVSFKNASIETNENKSINDNIYQQLVTGSNLNSNDYKIENNKSNLKSNKLVDSESSNVSSKNSSIETNKYKSINNNIYQQQATEINVNINDYDIEVDKPNVKSIKKIVESESSNTNVNHKLSGVSVNRMSMEKIGSNYEKYALPNISQTENEESLKLYPSNKFSLQETYTSNKRKLSKSVSYDQLNRARVLSKSDKESLFLLPSQELEIDKKYKNQSIYVKTDSAEDYERKIEDLSNVLKSTESEYKKKIEAVKVQYENNVKSIIKEHNQGVKSIQSLHEETLSDIIKMHDTEIENLRSMSIDAMRQVEKLKKENLDLKQEIRRSIIGLDEKPIKLSTSEQKKRKYKGAGTFMLTKTDVEAFNVRPKKKSLGPCTCSLDVNVSDTLRNIFEQVDEEQRKIAEQTYLNYLANKFVNNSLESLNAQELSFLHLKVCDIWKKKLTKEEILKLKIDSLEKELLNKQRKTQIHISELDRKVTEERQRLQEVRKAICKNSPVQSRDSSPTPASVLTDIAREDCICGCSAMAVNAVDKIRSAGDPTRSSPAASVDQKRKYIESHRAVLAHLDDDDNKGMKSVNYETPTRLRKTSDRSRRTHKK